MNEDVKAKWLEALRSGEYRQGDGYLRQNDEFCCLGVLCDLAVKSGVDIETSTTSDGVWGYKSSHEVYPRLYELPDSVRDWAGLNSAITSIEIPSQQDDTDTFSYLSDINDDHQPFTKIADLIEEYL